MNNETCCDCRFIEECCGPLLQVVADIWHAVRLKPWSRFLSPQNGRTLLMHAACLGQVEAAVFLLQRGAALQATDQVMSNLDRLTY